MNLYQIKEWCDSNMIIERSKEAFATALDDYINESYEEYLEVFGKDNSNITGELDNICYKVDLPDFDKEFIMVNINIIYKDTIKGWYRIIYKLNGDFFDDYFVIE